ncbi:TauD/TfdA family dioxygenase [Micromonospora profundi]|uniref:TauD/TfdA family dioxygenase n=1 Tax=Micromonospora profundi TaxID=1420889 RepID=A0AAJ6HVX5_9ACTN|nr:MULTISPECIES: TauD/TfdA family dioxygenase [Micromonospora]AGZ94282.1 hypothetical protein [Micromonospora sp. NRRL B-16802]KOX14628.1 hypothetical protein ADK66_00095 [Micromonospora sp. NRRL B-16802]NJC15703.1 alpha-ketoglutarate-dependent taurine dioxygenase [Micromonospora profundi]WLS47162.1 TauD/TfdA family dioxygenase [Micromonospora profundi]
MSGDDFSGESIVRNHVAAGGKSFDALVAESRAMLERNRIVLIRDFPLDPDQYLAFLGQFGTPLSNYSSRSDLAKDDPHPQINRVKYKPKGQYVKQSVHYVGGELRPHSARSWCTPRPAYFAMLMVDPGWRDTPEGERGESVVLAWRHLFEQLSARDGEAFEAHLAHLTGTAITFEANNVREELSNLPLCYPLADAAAPLDLGVRMKQDIQDKIMGLRDQIADYDGYRRALDYVVENAAEEKFQACFPMDSGDLLLLDNNRFGHGRRKIVGERTEDGATAVNKRELWSVTVV